MKYKFLLFIVIALFSIQNSLLAMEPVIFIHGIKGSVLQNKSGDVTWLTLSQSFGFSNPDLSLPIANEAREPMFAKAVLGKITIIPFLLVEKIYSPWLDASSKNYGNQFFTFTYDWRKDNLETLADLKVFINKISLENGNQKVNLVGHSMGGMLALAYANEMPEMVASLVLVSAPLQGGLGFFPDIHSGTATAFNKKILSSEVIASFPSIYCFFPEKTNEFFRDESGQPLEVDMYDPLDWKKFKLGIYSKKFDKINENDYDAFLKVTLPKAKKFKSMLKFKKIKYPRTLIVTAKSLPTLNFIKLKQGVWDLESEEKAMGDLRITEKNSLPDIGIPYETIFSEMEHSKILNDEKIISAILKFHEDGSPK